MRKILLSFLLCSSAVANAQLLKVTVADTTGLGTGMLACHGIFDDVTFRDGTYVFDREEFPRYREALVMFREGSFTVVLEKGETLQVKLTRKNGELIPDFKGKNRDASVFSNEVTLINAGGWQKMSIDEEGEEHVTQVENFDFDAELKRVEAEYPRIVKLAKKVKDVNLREKYLHYAELRLLSSRIAIVDAQERRAGRDPLKNHSDEIEALLAQINPNDTVANDMLLVERFVNSKRQYGRDSKDMSAMSSEYIAIINKYITEPKVRHYFFDNLASSVFNVDLATEIFDLEAFWAEYCKSAPKELTDYYQEIVDSKRATVAGAQCPDATFMDIDGNSHCLSEFFGKGKYLYIDLWATWCGPCCAEIPYIEKHVAHYKDNDRIQFISISIDSNKQAWKDKLAKDKPEWAQFVTRNKSEYEKLSKDWGITGIPRFIIINPDGTINNNAAFRPSAPDFRSLIDGIISN